MINFLKSLDGTPKGREKFKFQNCSIKQVKNELIVIQLNLPLQRSIYNESRLNENFFLLLSPLIHLLYQRPFHLLNGSSFPESLSIGK